MILIPVTCPDCGTDDITKYGKTKEGKQRCYCHNEKCETKTFILNYSYNGCLKNVKESIIDMAVNGSGIRDTARVLKISPNTVINAIKKKELDNVNYCVLEQIKDCGSIPVVIKPAEESELDEMWSFVQNKENQRWLWHAIDHLTGTVLAYVFGY
jgi:insertion element IS1 protein InsB